ncbi:ATP-binding protein [Alkalimonas collagenimarina]|uniref:histidine kinase n=1 Tax=Alkalimonas collagenimarina TaxID=400390 RepID=A0ABT9GV02_9GAMM|nr:ATP-binding protein [Alkalimonas collagenimarina]MDP4534886.1 ATP-binding protein [Alkalimonas collagenimarina]
MIQKTFSLKSMLITIIMLICSLTLISSLVISITHDINAQRSKLLNQLEAYATIVAFSSASNLQNNDSEYLEQQLQAFAAEPMIDNIHIYSYHSTQPEPFFFTSYNRQTVGPHPTQFHRLEQLQTPKRSGHYIEVIAPIISNAESIGYAYLRANTSELSQYTQNQIVYGVSMACIALLIAFMVAHRLQKWVTRPIAVLLEQVQRITKTQDFSLRAPFTDLEEVDSYSKALNLMLEKIERQFRKLQSAEQEIRQLNQSLEQKISERTLALKESNQELLSTLETLHQYQNQIVETEKMSSLGQMVAGIAHEVNTPIGLGITASTLMQDKLKVIEQCFEEKKLTSSQLARFLKEADENLSIVYRNLERAASLIRSFKQVAVDQSNDHDREFNMLQLINEVLLSLRPNLKKTSHEVIVSCPEHLVIQSKPGAINQILINLIMNSLIHAFSDKEHGQINITVTTENNDCQLFYQDNGSGVPEQIRKRIFDPFVTTKRGEGGSGLGMHLVYNLVTQALRGKIQLESSIDEGVHIFIAFPVILKSKKHNN